MSKSVLIIDGDEMARDCLGEGLAKFGYEVETISLGWAAEQFMEQKKFDLVLVDMMLDGKVSGLKLTKRFKELYPRGHVIATATYEDTEIEEAAAKLGVDAYLMKPLDVSPGNLLVQVRRILQD